MSEIQPITVINVFDVAPERQQELVDLLTRGTEDVVRHRPGFVSVTLLASHDGTRVVNHAQWRAPDDVQATLSDPEVQAYVRRAAELADMSGHVYAVAHRAAP